MIYILIYVLLALGTAILLESESEKLPEGHELKPEQNYNLRTYFTTCLLILPLCILAYLILVRRRVFGEEE